MLTFSAMQSVARRRSRLALISGLWALAACGKITFGDALVPQDASAGAEDAEPNGTRDAAPPVADAGMPPAGDGGCVPVTLPANPPSSNPFANDEATYRAVFWTWADTNGCSRGPCHGMNRPPLIPVPSSVTAQWQDAMNQFYALIGSSGWADPNTAMPSGAYWRHHSRSPNFIAPAYSAAQVEHLADVYREAWGCVASKALSNTDAGASCGSGGGAEDAGAGGGGDAAADGDGAAGGDGHVAEDAQSGGGGGSVPCFCEERPDAGPLNTNNCAP